MLVLGGKLDKVRQVAERCVGSFNFPVRRGPDNIFYAIPSYGFKHAYNTLDILAWKPSSVFRSLRKLNTFDTRTGSGLFISSQKQRNLWRRYGISVLIRGAL